MNRAQWANRPGRSSSWCKKTKRLAIYIRDGFRCAYCGADLKDKPPREMALDHLAPKVNGGWHEATNLVLACRGCNSARQERPWRQFVHQIAARRMPTESLGRHLALLMIAEINNKRRRKLNYSLARSMIAGAAQEAQSDG